jgi:glycosyltransferase involved in cell wall biosynthesis
VPERVAVIGSLASCDLGLGESLLRAGIDATVLRSAVHNSLDDLDPEVFPHVHRRGVEMFDSPGDLASRLRRFAFVFSFTSSVAFHLDRFFVLYRLGRRAGWPPWINICTGSDITELAVADTRAGRFQRRAMRSAFVNVLPAYPWATRNAVRIGLRNAVVLPFPFRPMDLEPLPMPTGDQLVVFHPTRLDWGATDNAPERTSTKGNDRFLRAFARVARELERPIRLVLLDRGPDRHLARALLDKLGVGDLVEWRGAMNHRELYDAIQEANLVVDQFDVGGLGGIAWESLALGRPVLTYLHEESSLLSFDQPVPVFNAHTEDEITAALSAAADPAALARRAANVREWMSTRRHGFLDRYLYYMGLAIGRHAFEVPAPGPIREDSHARTPSASGL